jgi:hypothetical protein
MKINKYSLTAAQDEDATKYHFAEGSLVLRGLADRLSEIFHDGEHIVEHELREMHADLKYLWDILVAESIAGIGAEAVGAEHHRTYSDGSQVAYAPAIEDFVNPVPAHFRELQISHMPPANVARSLAREKRCSSIVMTELPPHERPISTHKKGGGTRAHARKRPVTRVASAPTHGDVRSLRARLEAYSLD